MKIGYCVEGNADRAVLIGLRDRWCKHAELIEGKFRGDFLRSQISKECKILHEKGAELIVFLRDANKENWHDVLRADLAKCPVGYRHKIVIGVCDRNVECWFASAADDLAKKFDRDRRDFTMDDPSHAIKEAFGLIGFDKEEQEPYVAAYVASAPLKQWLKNKSFEHFYDQFWLVSKKLQCTTMENLR